VDGCARRSHAASSNPALVGEDYDNQYDHVRQEIRDLLHEHTLAGSKHCPLSVRPHRQDQEKREPGLRLSARAPPGVDGQARQNGLWISNQAAQGSIPASLSSISVMRAPATISHATVAAKDRPQSP